MNLVNNKPSEKPELGQVWTPSKIALEMAQECLKLKASPKLILDPACGPGTFSKAFYEAGLTSANIYCIDIDQRMADFTKNINKKLGLKCTVQNCDYLKKTNLKEKFDIVIMNPPYIRQEKIPLSDKGIYHSYLQGELQEKIGRRANLFALFMLKGLVDLAPNGILCAIVYDAIFQTKYGKEIIELINRHAKMIFRKKLKMPFENILVDTEILIYKKLKTPLRKEIINTIYNDDLVFLHELLNTRRGTGLPSRKVFLTGKGDPYSEYSLPFLVKQSSLSSLIVAPDKRAYLLKDISNRNSKVKAWLNKKAKNQNIILKKIEISGVKGKIAFNYYIRDAARHLWNSDNIAVSDNFYVSNPKDGFPTEAAWLLLNSSLYLNKITSNARNQGSGLSKLQLYEYRQTRLPDWRSLTNEQVELLVSVAKKLISSDATYKETRDISDHTIKGFFND